MADNLGSLIAGLAAAQTDASSISTALLIRALVRSGALPRSAVEDDILKPLRATMSANRDTDPLKGEGDEVTIGQVHGKMAPSNLDAFVRRIEEVLAAE